MIPQRPLMSHKIGDTFAWGGALEWRDAQGVLLDPTGIVGAAQLRTSRGSLIADLDVTITGDASAAAATIVQKSEDDSSAWPVGMAQLDVQFTLQSGHVVSTQTMQVELIQDITKV